METSPVYIEILRLPVKQSILEIAKIFTEEEIDFLLDDTRPAFDITFVSGGAPLEYIVKVREDHFQKAINLLEENKFFTDNDTSNLFDQDGDFQNIINLDESEHKPGNSEDILNNQDLEPMQNKNIESNVSDIDIKPEKAKNIIIVIGYLWALVGTLLCIPVGIYLLSKRNNDNNVKINRFDYDSRLHGWLIIAISILIFVLYLFSFGSKIR